MCGLDVPPGRLPRGSGPVRVGLLPWLRCVLQPRPVPHRKSRAEIGLGDLQGAWQFFFLTSWGSSLPSALLAGGWAGAGGAWQQDPGLSEPGEPALQVCGGGGAAATAACSPIPSGESTHRHFRQRSGCLVLGWFYLCCQRDGGEESGRPRWGLGFAGVS